MTKKAIAKPVDDGLVPSGGKSKLEVVRRKDEKVGRTLARVTLDPQTRNASLAMTFGTQMFSDQYVPEIMETSAVLGEEIQQAMKGDLSLATRMFTSQAFALDTLFTEMARRSGLNMGQYPDAADRYMRLALKAQSACRTTLEALAKLHQPREQTVKHVHINSGAQAVVADAFHQYKGGTENGKTDNQSHTAGTTCDSTPLLSQNAEGNGMPIPSREVETAMQDARRDKSGCADGKP